MKLEKRSRREDETVEHKVIHKCKIYSSRYFAGWILECTNPTCSFQDFYHSRYWVSAVRRGIRHFQHS